ncbi:hypothetical protein Hanom_Chr00s000988g01671051 [Helianthus anomalus]
MALREALDEMTSVEEVLIDCINYLAVGLENSFQEINLLHQRLNILAMPPMEPIFPQDDWNLAQEVINPTGWDDIPAEPPFDNLQGVPVEVTPLQNEDANEPTFILPREIEEWLNDVWGGALFGEEVLQASFNRKKNIFLEILFLK